MREKKKQIRKSNSTRPRAVTPVPQIREHETIHAHGREQIGNSPNKENKKLLCSLKYINYTYINYNKLFPICHDKQEFSVKWYIFFHFRKRWKSTDTFPTERTFVKSMRRWTVPSGRPLLTVCFFRVNSLCRMIPGAWWLEPPTQTQSGTTDTQ